MLEILQTITNWALTHTSEITEVGNWMAVLASGMGLIAGGVWIKRNHMEFETGVFVVALMGAFVYIFVSRTFWSLGLKFAEEGEKYGIWFETWKAFMTLPVSIILLVSVIMLVSVPELFENARKLALFIGASVIATLLMMI